MCDKKRRRKKVDDRSFIIKKGKSKTVHPYLGCSITFAKRETRNGNDDSLNKVGVAGSINESQSLVKRGEACIEGLVTEEKKDAASFRHRSVNRFPSPQNRTVLEWVE